VLCKTAHRGARNFPVAPRNPPVQASLRKVSER
jgi:hypothetical protein